MPRDWSRQEVEATATEYFTMLGAELRGEPVNKREHNRRLQRLLDDRSAGAIEFKHANISAILIELGYPYVDGYKPRGNYQELLREVVVSRLASDPSISHDAAKAVAEPEPVTPAVMDWTSVHVKAPSPERDRERFYERRSPGTSPVRGTNYLEREASNASLGAAGEEFVLQFEHARLWASGARGLAERIEHVSRTRGDGLGYDILSFEEDGRERLIEVKTTRFGVMTPFFASSNEVDCSETAGDQYHLYRVFKFREAPRLFWLPGPLRESVSLRPVLFRASLS